MPQILPFASPPSETPAVNVLLRRAEARQSLKRIIDDLQIIVGEEDLDTITFVERLIHRVTPRARRGRQL